MYNVVSKGRASQAIFTGEGKLYWWTVSAFSATTSRYEWVIMICCFGCTKGKEYFPLFYNLQQAETTRRHEQVLEHVKEKVKDILSFKKVNHHNHIAVEIILLLMKLLNKCVILSLLLAAIGCWCVTPFNPRRGPCCHAIWQEEDVLFV